MSRLNWWPSGAGDEGETAATTSTLTAIAKKLNSNSDCKGKEKKNDAEDDGGSAAATAPATTKKREKMVLQQE